MRLKICCIFCCFFLLSSHVAHAALEITHTAPPTSINEDGEFTLTLTITGIKSGTEYYFAGSFTKPEKTNYFGLTKNNIGNWEASSGNHLNLYKVSNDGSYEISFKPDPTSSQYHGEGSYLFKIRRFTAGGSYEWINQSEPATLFLTSTQPTATPTQEVKNSPTQTETEEALIPLLTEVYPCPATSQPEWIELFNPYTKELNVNGWQLKDAAQHSFSLEGTIPPQSIQAFDLPVAMMNNSTDTLSLLNPAGQTSQSMSYTSCSTETSWIFHSSSWQQTLTITKQSSNVLTIPISDEPTPKPTLTVKPTTTPRLSTTPTQVNKIPTATTKSSITPKKTPAATQPFLTPILIASDSGMVLGATDEANPFISNDTNQLTISQSQSRTPLLILIFTSSAVLLGVGGYILWDWYKKNIEPS